MRGMRQLAASDNAAPLGPAAWAVASVTCLAAKALFCGIARTSSQPGMPLEASTQASLQHVLVRMAVFSCQI